MEMRHEQAQTHGLVTDIQSGPPSIRPYGKELRGLAVASRVVCHRVLSYLLCGASAPGEANETTSTAQAIRFIQRTNQYAAVSTSSGAHRNRELAVRITAGSDGAAAVPPYHPEEEQS